MTNIATVLARWLCYVAFAAMLLPLGACSQQLPLPEGVNPQATPRIIVTKERIEINGHALRLGVSAKTVWEPWVEALGPGNVYNEGWSRWWEPLGIVLKVSSDGPTLHSDTLNVFLHRGRFFFWGDAAYGMEASTSLPKPFAGYLEIDGVPIGSKMRLEELQRRREKQGLPQLRRDGLTGEYFAYEKDRYSQLYFFDDDGVLAHVQLL